MVEKNLYIIILLVLYIWIYYFPTNTCENFSLTDEELEKLKLKFLNEMEKKKESSGKEESSEKEKSSEKEESSEKEKSSINEDEELKKLKDKLLKKINKPNVNKLSFYFLGTGILILIMVICLCIKANQDHSIQNHVLQSQ